MSTPASAPLRVTALVALALALAGAAISIVLLREHLTVFEGDIAGGLFCGGAGRFDCNTVAAHPSSWLLGLPLPLWGIVCYAAAAALALLAWRLPDGEAAAAAGLGSVLALSAVVIDAWLATIMFTQIGAVCLNCVSTWLINLALAVTFWRLDHRLASRHEWRALFMRWRTPRPGRMFKLSATVVAIAGAATASVLTVRTVRELIEDSRQEAGEFLKRAATERPIDMARFDGLPSEGPASARITIVVASDFECSFCRALAARLDDARAEFPNDLRVVFLNAPINSRCNPFVHHETHNHACWLARAGVCAARQGRFWPYHQLVYRTIPPARVDSTGVSQALARAGVDPASLAACMATADIDSVVARDVRIWKELNMQSVPSLVINGHLKSGGIYPTALRAVIQALLAKPG